MQREIRHIKIKKEGKAMLSPLDRHIPVLLTARTIALALTLPFTLTAA